MTPAPARATAPRQTTPRQATPRKATPRKRAPAQPPSPAAVDASSVTDVAKPTSQLRPGQLVTHTYFDHYAGAGGVDVTVVALVLGVSEAEDGTPLATVAVLPGVGPLPAAELVALS